MANKRLNDLGNDKISTLLWRLALPAVAAQLVNALYNIVDRMYIGHMAGVGDLALTGLGVTFPILMFISALSALVGMGGGSRAAIAMGAGDEKGANKILGNCVALIVVISIAVTVLFQIFQTPMLMAFGAAPETIGYATDYLTNFITTQGFSGTSMATVLIGAVVNIVLDPILIFGFDMGVKGAAWATIIAQTVSAIWVICFLVGKRTKLKIQRKYIRL
ncbi:MAG: MATE family efflux transporter, partial [Oscillospiraceae bacterium]